MMTVRLITTCLLVITLYSGVTAQSKDSMARSYFFAAEENYKKKEYSEAISNLEEAVKLLGSTNSRIQYLMVKACYDSGRYIKAKEEMDKYFKVTDESRSDEVNYQEIVRLIAPINNGIVKENEAKARAERERIAEEEEEAAREREEFEEIRKKRLEDPFSLINFHLNTVRDLYTTPDGIKLTTITKFKIDKNIIKYYQKQNGKGKGPHGTFEVVPECEIAIAYLGYCHLTTSEFSNDNERHYIGLGLNKRYYSKNNGFGKFYPSNEISIALNKSFYSENKVKQLYKSFWIVMFYTQEKAAQGSNNNSVKVRNNPFEFKYFWDIPGEVFYEVGKLFEEGYAFEKNIERALEYYKVGADRGHEESKNIYERLKKLTNRK